MKKINFLKMLLLSFILSIASINQMWGDTHWITNVSDVWMEGTITSPNWTVKPDAWKWTQNDANHYTGTFFIPYSSTKYQIKIRCAGDGWTDGNLYSCNGYWFTSANTTASNYNMQIYNSAVDQIECISSASGYIALDCEFYGKYSDNSYLRITQSAVTNLSPTLSVGSSTLEGGQTTSVSASCTGGSGNYTYSYVVMCGEVDVTASVLSASTGSPVTFTAPCASTEKTYTITVTATDANSQLTGLGFESQTDTKTITVGAIGTPEVSLSIIKINVNQITLTGTITNYNGYRSNASDLNEVGFYLGETKYTASYKDGSTFTKTITGLTANQTYSVKAFATNPLSTGYSSTGSVTTLTDDVYRIQVRVYHNAPTPHIYAWTDADSYGGSKMENAAYASAPEMSLKKAATTYDWYYYDAHNRYEQFLIYTTGDSDKSGNFTATRSSDCYWYNKDGSPTKAATMDCPYFTPELYIETTAGGEDYDYYEMSTTPSIQKTISLAAKSTYKFKIVYDTEYFGKGSTTLTRASSTASSPAVDGDYINITTDAAGDYTFTFATSPSKSISVTYPTAYTVTFGYGTGGSSVTASAPSAKEDDFDSGDYVAAGDNVTFEETHLTGYTLTGWFTASSGGEAVSGMSASDNVLDAISANANVYAQYSENLTNIVISYGDHGSITTPDPLADSYDLGVTTKQAIVAAPASGDWVFDSWVCTGNAAVDAQSASTNAKGNGEGGTGTITAKFESVWAVMGSGTEMGGWSKFNSLDITETANTYSGSITLAANTTYKFKLKNRSEGADVYWGFGEKNKDWQLAYIGQSEAFDSQLENEGGKMDLVLMTANAGEYTFTYNTSSKYLTVGFPEQAHPSGNNIYFKNSGGTPYSGVSVHIWGGATGGTTSWNRIPSMPTCSIAGELYYYAAAGDNTLCKFANTSDKSTQTGNLTVTKGHYYDLSSEDWLSFEISITLNNHGANTGEEGTTSLTGVKLNEDVLTQITNPQKTGYTFGGYYSEENGEGVKLIEVDGDWIASVAGYTDASKHWIAGGLTPELHAYWIPNELTFNATSTNKWNNTANWSEAILPTLEHPVKISAEVIVDVKTAVAGSVTFSGTGKLNIKSAGVLEVTGTIDNNTADNIVIESDAVGQGALIFDNSLSTQAKVEVYAKVNTYDSYQCIALPVTWAGVSDSYKGSGVYTYVWNEGTGWERRGYYEALSAFEGIGLTQSATSTYIVSGTLASTDNFEASLAYTSGTYQGTNVFGNSWTAPIQVKKISISGAADKTVYIANNGSWAAKTLESVAEDVVVPALQSYAIIATGAGATVSIDYDEAVRKNTYNRTTPLQAPKRNASDGMTRMNLRVSDNDTYSDLQLFEDAQLFTEEFDNGWEARYLAGDGRSGQLYVQKEHQMVVLAEPNLEGTVVGLIQGKSSNYTITVSGDGKGYYLNDVKTGNSTLIAEGNTYNFTSDESTNSTRFVISKTPMSPTSVDNISDGVNARKQLIDGSLYIIREGRIYNVEGALVK